MSSPNLPDYLENKLPSRKIFITIILVLLSLTIGSMVVLANESTVVVESSVLNVRYGPGLSHDVLTQVEENDRLTVLDEENKWYKVLLSNDQIGWVASWLVASNNIIDGEKEFIRVNTSAVNIREYGNADSEILGVVYEDTELQVLYKDSPWYQVLYMGQVAWIHGDYTDSVDPTTTADTQSNEPEINDSNTLVRMGDLPTNIRTAPSTEDEIIYQAAPGESFEYIETIDDWYHVRIDEHQSGYVANWVSHREDNGQEETVSDDSINSPGAQYARKVSSLAEATIVVDPGHGGKDPGAISSDESIFEKDVALSTALLLRNRLQDAGANVVLTRAQDISVSLNQRVETSHQHNADAFISLHYDAVEVANTMSGTTTYYQTDNNLEMANTINQYLTQNVPAPNNGVRSANYQVLRTNKQPAILLELGYMNHSTDTQKIDTVSYQSAIVEAIYLALRDYYGH